jgi:hypothetical protein
MISQRLPFPHIGNENFFRKLLTTCDAVISDSRADHGEKWSATAFKTTLLASRNKNNKGAR